MTAHDAMGEAAARIPKVGYVLANLVAWCVAIFRRPRPARGLATFVPAWRRYALYSGVVVIAILASMMWFDAIAITLVARLPPSLNELFNEITDLGLSGWFLVPVGTLILLAAVADVPWLKRRSHLLLATFVVRLGFLFLAIGVPGLLGTMLKRLIGRVRPSQLGPFAYEPLSWQSAYASLPSGHATTAFSVLVAFGAIFPRLRPALWIFAILIASSRVVIAAHYPSDVLAGAVFGGFGALMVRDWYAVRRLGFHVGSDGEVRALPVPSPARLKGVARRLFAF